MDLLTRSTPFVTIASAFLFTGCTGLFFGGGLGSGQTDDDIPQSSGGWDDPTTPEDHIDSLEGCDPELDRDEIRDELELSYAFQSSMHELVVCGGITQQFCNGILWALIDGFLTNELKPPAGLQWKGKGYYTTSPDPDATVVMDLQVFWPFDSGPHQKGAPIIYDLFETENYFVNSWSEVDQQGLSITVHFDEHGPLAPLLGIAPDTPSPILFTFEDMLAASEVIYEVGVQGEIIVYDDRTTSEIGYLANIEQGTVGDLANRLQFQISDARGTAPGQQLDVSSWELEFGSGMNGEIAFGVRGDRLDYDGWLTYEGDKYGDLTFACVDPPQR